PYLVATKSVTVDVGQGVVERADVGDTLRYDILVVNAGDAPATGVWVEDPLPENTTFEPGSLRLDGLPIPAGEGASVVDGLVRVELGDLASGGQRVLSLAVRIDAGPLVSNQARSFADDAAPVLSDGDPSSPGSQPTV